MGIFVSLHFVKIYLLQIHSTYAYLGDRFWHTQLNQVAGDTLIISVIPADTGKSTTKLEKAKVKDGSCCWDKPHHETVKFVQDPKNGKFHEKIYNLVLATVPIVSHFCLPASSSSVK